MACHLPAFCCSIPPVVFLSLFLLQESPRLSMESLRQRGFPSSKLCGREVTCLLSPVARDHKSLLHLIVTLLLAVPTVALTIQEAPPLTAPKALGLWTAPKSTSSLTAADSRYLGLWQSLTTDKEQQTNTSLAGKSQKAAHHRRNLK